MHLAAVSGVRDWTTSSLGERVLHAASLRGWGINQFGEKSGLTGGPVSRLSRRTERYAGAPETLLRLAIAASVSPQWLAFGLGQPEEPSLPGSPADRYPNRATAAAIARQGGVGEAAVQSVVEEAFALEADPPVLWWIDRMRLREAEMRSQRGATETPSSTVIRRRT